VRRRAVTCHPEHEIRLDGTLWTVVGIVPADFQLLGQTSLWAMRPLVNLPPRLRAAYIFQAGGRMEAGVSIKAAEADRSLASPDSCC
jgi:hypothetical protein